MVAAKRELRYNQLNSTITFKRAACLFTSPYNRFKPGVDSARRRLVEVVSRVVR